MAKKIMFNDRYGLTQAVLEGRKTMTRRIVPKKYDVEWDEYNKILFVNTDYGRRPNGWVDIREVLGYRVGEVVAIAQSYKDAGYSEKEVFAGWPFSRAGWNNKLFVAAGKMLHHIRITDVRVERLNDITPDDCLKEGISFIDKIKAYYFDRSDRDQGFYYYTAKHAFASLIDKVSGKGVWDSNPYVFVYEFELVD